MDGAVFNGCNDKWDKFLGYDEYYDFSYIWIKECKRILKPNGTIWVIGSFQNIYQLGFILQKLNFWILNDVIWSKPNAVPNFNGTRFQNSHETLLWCSKSKNSKYTFNYKTMKFLNGGKQEKSVWNIGICIGNERLKDSKGNKIHNTQKPEELLKKIILSSTKPNDVILDPFFGSGTTGAVARKNNRNFIGIEKDEKYIKYAQKRIEKIKPETTNINDLSMEVLPPKVSVKKLIEKNYLNIGEILYNSSRENICFLLKNGDVIDKDEQTLSIHKMSAKYLKKINNNGWTYFYIKRNNILVSINDLRYKYNKEQNDK